MAVSFVCLEYLSPLYAPLETPRAEFFAGYTH
jgi:hypothetical protein